MKAAMATVRGTMSRMYTNEDYDNNKGDDKGKSITTYGKNNGNGNQGDGNKGEGDGNKDKGEGKSDSKGVGNKGGIKHNNESEKGNIRSDDNKGESNKGYGSENGNNKGNGKGNNKGKSNNASDHKIGKKVSLDMSRNTSIEIQPRGEGRKTPASRSKTKTREIDGDGFVSVANKGSPNKKSKSTIDESKSQKFTNSFTVLRDNDEDGNEDSDEMYDTVEFTDQNDQDKMNSVVQDKMDYTNETHMRTHKLVQKISAFTAKQNLMASASPTNLAKLHRLSPNGLRHRGRDHGRGRGETPNSNATNQPMVVMLAKSDLERTTHDLSQEEAQGEGKEEENDVQMEENRDANNNGKDTGGDTNDNEDDDESDDDESDDDMDAPQGIPGGKSMEHFGIRVEAIVKEEFLNMNAVRDLLSMFAKAKCTFYDHQEMGGANEASTTGVNWEELKELNDNALIKYLNLSMIEWGSPRDKTLRLRFSMWVDCQDSKNVGDLKKAIPECTDFLKKHGWYLKNHNLHQSQEFNVAFILGRHPDKTFKEGIRETVSDFINDKSSNGTPSIYVDIVYAKVLANDTRVPVLAIECGWDDRQTIDNILKSGAQHPTIDIVSEKLRRANKTAFEKAIGDHMDVCQSSTAITITGVDHISAELTLRTKLMEKKNDKSDSLIVDLEKHRLYSKEGTYYVICHRDDIEEATAWTTQCLQTLDCKWWKNSETLPSIINTPTKNPTRKPQDTEWDNYTFSSRTFVSRGSVVTDGTTGTTWADRVKGMNSNYRIPKVITPKLSDADSTGDSSKGSLTASSFVANSDKATDSQTKSTTKENPTPIDMATMTNLIAQIAALTAQVQALTAMQAQGPPPNTSQSQPTPVPYEHYGMYGMMPGMPRMAPPHDMGPGMPRMTPQQAQQLFNNRPNQNFLPPMGMVHNQWQPSQMGYYPQPGLYSNYQQPNYQYEPRGEPIVNQDPLAPPQPSYNPMPQDPPLAAPPGEPPLLPPRATPSQGQTNKKRNTPTTPIMSPVLVSNGVNLHGGQGTREENGHDGNLNQAGLQQNNEIDWVKSTQLNLTSDSEKTTKGKRSRMNNTPTQSQGMDETPIARGGDSLPPIDQNDLPRKHLNFQSTPDQFNKLAPSPDPPASKMNEQTATGDTQHKANHLGSTEPQGESHR